MSVKDPDLDLLKSIRLIAWDAVENKPPEYILRKIQRWYSKTFYVPLPEIDIIPIEDLLLHWFESQFEDMEESEDPIKEEIVKKLLETREERLAREAKEAIEEAEDEAWFKQVEAKTKKSAKIRDMDSGPKVDNLQDDPLPAAFKDIEPPEVAAKLPKLQNNIKMEFNIDENELDWDVLGPPRKDDEK